MAEPQPGALGAWLSVAAEEIARADIAAAHGDVDTARDRLADALAALRATQQLVDSDARQNPCTRTEDHLRHSIPMTFSCPGIGEQVCRPDDYQHLGPWKHVYGSDSLSCCTACGTVIGK